MTYNINHTRLGKAPIQVEETGMNTDLDVAFPGRIRLEWGEEVNENLLRLLENFSAPEQSGNPGNPDTNQTVDNTLSNPIQGQLWFNSTQKRLYSFTGTMWLPYTNSTQDYAANWGQLQHGQFLPQPVSSNGYIFPYNECIYSVSAFNYLVNFDYVNCSVSTNGQVTMQYRNANNSNIINGIANYMIVGIRNNNNLGNVISIPGP